MIPKNFNWKQKYRYFLEYSKIVDVRPLPPANLDDVGNKSLFEAFFDLKKVKFKDILTKASNLADILTENTEKTNWRAIFKRKTNNIAFKNINETTQSKTDKNLFQNYGKCV